MQTAMRQPVMSLQEQIRLESVSSSMRVVEVDLPLEIRHFIKLYLNLRLR